MSIILASDISLCHSNGVMIMNNTIYKLGCWILLLSILFNLMTKGL